MSIKPAGPSAGYCRLLDGVSGSRKDRNAELAGLREIVINIGYRNRHLPPVHGRRAWRRESPCAFAGDDRTFGSSELHARKFAVRAN